MQKKDFNFSQVIILHHEPDDGIQSAHQRPLID
jgi:hypothetical protein